MEIRLASHFGMCFGVRDALEATHRLAESAPLTVLGELVHNPVVHRRLEASGVRQADLDAPSAAVTQDVVITAHGASDRDIERWRREGHRVHNTTCPLVHRAHRALATLVADGYAPVVIGQRSHVEVRGLVGDFPGARVVLTDDEAAALPAAPRIGVVSQTTQPVERVKALVERIRRHQPGAEVRFVDTVCQPTKDRQAALVDLCAHCRVVVVVGGHNSNNTTQLARRARELGAVAHHVAGPGELRAEWFSGVDRVGITAGTSTLEATVLAVRDAIAQLAAARGKSAKGTGRGRPPVRDARGGSSGGASGRVPGGIPTSGTRVAAHRS